MKMEALWMETRKWFQSAASVILMNTWLSWSSDFNKTGLDIHYRMVKEILSWVIWSENELDCVDLALKLYQSTAEPGGLLYMGSHRVGDDWRDWAAAAAAAAAAAIKRASQVAQMVKNSPAGNLGSIPEWGRFPGGEHGNPFHSCLENPRGQRWATVHRVTQSQTWLSN